MAKVFKMKMSQKTPSIKVEVENDLEIIEVSPKRYRSIDDIWEASNTTEENDE